MLLALWLLLADYGGSGNGGSGGTGGGGYGSGGYSAGYWVIVGVIAAVVIAAAVGAVMWFRSRRRVAPSMHSEPQRTDRAA